MYFVSLFICSRSQYVYKVCRKKILNMTGSYPMTGVYTSVGSMAPFYVFPCGHSFHAQCLIAHVTKCTTEAQVSSGMYRSSRVKYLTI